jgi:aminoglycoside phosphotransferase (APT) family kinase protein
VVIPISGRAIAAFIPSVPMPVWTAEVEVDEELVRRLLAQFELGDARLQKLAEGWDHSVWVVDERYVFRFPRREVAIPGFEREFVVLPKLAPRLPLPVPLPAFVGKPAEEFPWPFFGAELIPGVEAGVAELDDDARIEVGLELAAFLRALHALELDEPLPLDPNGRTDLGKRVRLAREGLGALERLGLWHSPPELEPLLEEALQLPPPEPPAVVHGDLHFRHLLVNGRAATGVIDWGDVCLADSAVDLPLLWSFVPPRGREAFLDAYGSITETQLRLSRLLSVQLCAVLAHYGHSEGQPELVRAGLEGLTRTLDGPPPS